MEVSKVDDETTFSLGGGTRKSRKKNNLLVLGAIILAKSLSCTKPWLVGSQVSMRSRNYFSSNLMVLQRLEYLHL